jgi:hypothetical protein
LTRPDATLRESRAPPAAAVAEPGPPDRPRAAAAGGVDVNGNPELHIVVWTEREFRWATALDECGDLVPVHDLGEPAGEQP